MMALCQRLFRPEPPLPEGSRLKQNPIIFTFTTLLQQTAIVFRLAACRRKSP